MKTIESSDHLACSLPAESDGLVLGFGGRVPESLCSSKYWCDKVYQDIKNTNPVSNRLQFPLKFPFASYDNWKSMGVVLDDPDNSQGYGPNGASRSPPGSLALAQWLLSKSPLRNPQNAYTLRGESDTRSDEKGRWTMAKIRQGIEGHHSYPPRHHMLSKHGFFGTVVAAASGGRRH